MVRHLTVVLHACVLSHIKRSHSLCVNVQSVLMSRNVFSNTFWEKCLLLVPQTAFSGLDLPNRPMAGAGLIKIHTYHNMCEYNEYKT